MGQNRLATVASGGKAADQQDEKKALADYRFAAEAVRQCLELADLAAEAGRVGIAAQLLLGALTDIVPQLAALDEFVKLFPL